MSVAVAYNHDDRSREPNGRFASEHRPAPGSGVAGDPRYGSFLFPEKNAFSGEIDEYVDFFMNGRVDDDVLVAARNAYRNAHQRALEEAAQRGFDAFNNDDDMVEWTLSIGTMYETTEDGFPARGLDGDYIVKEEVVARRQMWIDEAVEEERKKWPASHRIPSYDIRTVVRVGQAVRARAILGEESREEELLATPIGVSVDGLDGLTFGEVGHRYRFNSWLHEALP